MWIFVQSYMFKYNNISRAQLVVFVELHAFNSFLSMRLTSWTFWKCFCGFVRQVMASTVSEDTQYAVDRSKQQNSPGKHQDDTKPRENSLVDALPWTKDGGTTVCLPTFARSTKTDSTSWWRPFWIWLSANRQPAFRPVSVRKCQLFSNAKKLSNSILGEIEL